MPCKLSLELCAHAGSTFVDLAVLFLFWRVCSRRSCRRARSACRAEPAQGSCLRRRYAQDVNGAAAGGATNRVWAAPASYTGGPGPVVGRQHWQQGNRESQVTSSLNPRNPNAPRLQTEKSFFILNLESVQLCPSAVLPHAISAQNCAEFEVKHKSNSSWTHSNPGIWKLVLILR